MVAKLSGHHLSGDGPIEIFEFLERLARAANTLKMSNTQAFIALLSFLEKLAKSQYKAGAEMDSLEEENVSEWPNAVQYLK